MLPFSTNATNSRNYRIKGRHRKLLGEISTPKVGKGERSMSEVENGENALRNFFIKPRR